MKTFVIFSTMANSMLQYGFNDYYLNFVMSLRKKANLKNVQKTVFSYFFIEMTFSVETAADLK
jgi:hypothetical protein